jgi:predicted ATPase
MVQRLRLQNFRSFKDATIELRPLNIVVGANASGKTNLVQAFRFLRDLARSGLENAVALQGGAEYLTNLQSREREVTIELTITPNRVVYPKSANREGLIVESIYHELTIQTIRSKNSARMARETVEVRYVTTDGGMWTVKMTRRGKSVRLKTPDSNILHAIFTGGNRFELDTSLSLFELTPVVLGLPPSLYEANIATYDFSPKRAKQAISAASPHILSEDGSNLPLVVQQLLRDSRQRERLLRLVQSVLPYIQHLHTTMVGGQHVQMLFRETYHGRRALPAILLSDGTVEIVALVVALFFSRPFGGVVALEQPERNQHPCLMGALMELFRAAAERNRVLITTHNSELVRHAELDELVLVERDAESNSIIRRSVDPLHTQQLLGV